MLQRVYVLLCDPTLAAYQVRMPVRERPHESLLFAAGASSSAAAAAAVPHGGDEESRDTEGEGGGKLLFYYYNGGVMPIGLYGLPHMQSGCRAAFNSEKFVYPNAHSRYLFAALQADSSKDKISKKNEKKKYISYVTAAYLRLILGNIINYARWPNSR